MGQRSARAIALGVTAVLAGGLAPIAATSMTSAATTTVMKFGNPDVGSGCNFPCDDDHSFHAVDRVRPGAVRIKAGDTVMFDVEGFHQVAVYEPGVRPADIDPDAATFPFVNDAEGRLALGTPTVDFQYTFDQPGKYLVLCNVAPHFEEAQMWGWVIVG